MRSHTLPLKQDAFNDVLKIIIPTDTENSKDAFLSAIKPLHPELQDIIFVALLLNFRNILSNIALTNLSSLVKFTSPNVLEDLPEKLIRRFIENLHKFKSKDMTYLGQLTKNFANSVPTKYICDYVESLINQNLFALDKETILICVTRKPEAMTTFIQHFAQTSDYNKILQIILTSLICPKFDYNILSSIILLFLSDCLKIDTKNFSSFISYFSRTVSFIPFNDTMDIKQYALLYFQNIFLVRPEIKTIVLGVLREKMKNVMLSPNEAIIMIHTHDNYDIHDIVQATINKGGPISILNHISMKTVENPMYADLLDILLPASICLMKVTDRHVQTITKTIPDLKRFYYLPKVLVMCLNMNRAPIISAYAIYQPIASALLHIIAIFNSTKKSLLKPIEEDFSKNPGDSFTALFIMASSTYVPDIATFKRVAKAIVRTCIKDDFKQKIRGYDFLKKLKNFVENKMTNNESVQKFILKCYAHKQKMNLKASTVIKDIENLKPAKLRGKTKQMIEQQEQQEQKSDDEDIDNYNTPSEFYLQTINPLVESTHTPPKVSDLDAKKSAESKKSNSKKVSAFDLESANKPTNRVNFDQQTVNDGKPMKPLAKLQNSKTQEYVVEPLPKFDANIANKSDEKKPKKEEKQGGVIGFFGMFNFFRNIASNDVFDEDKPLEEKPMKLSGKSNTVQRSQPVFTPQEVSDESLSIDEELEAPDINLSEEESSNSEPLDDLNSIYAK